jgi:hypothetical protein
MILYKEKYCVRFIVVSLVFLFFVLLVPNTHARERKKSRRKLEKKVAVWEISALGLDDQVVQNVRQELKQVLKPLIGIPILSDEDVAKRLKRKKIHKNSSMKKTVRALGVKWVISGTLGGLGDELSVDLKLLSGANGKEIRRVAADLPSVKTDRRHALEEVLIQLLSPSKWVGKLAIDVSVEGAEVQLDGKKMAITPLKEPISGLVPGKHILRITKEGYGELSQFVVIRYNQVARIKVDMTNAMVVGLIYEGRGPKNAKDQEKDPKAEEKKAPEKEEISAPAVPLPDRGPSIYKTVTSWTLLGTGLGLAGTGVFFLASDDKVELGTILTASGGLLMLGSLTFFLLNSNRRSFTQQTAKDGFVTAPIITSDIIGLGFAGHF